MVHLSKSKFKPISTTVQKAHLEGWKFCAEMKWYAMNGKRDQIIDEVARHLRMARKFREHKLICEFANFIGYYYTFTLMDEKRGEPYFEESQRHSYIVYLEYLFSSKFAKIAKRISGTASPDTALLSDIESLISEYQKSEKYDSIQMRIDQYTLMNILASYNEEHSNIISQSEEIITYLESIDIPRTASFYKDMAAALIRTGQYSNAKVSIEKAIAMIPKDSDVHGVFIYYSIIVFLHQGRYRKAYEAFKHAEQKRYLRRSLTELWNVLKGYFVFLQMAGKIDDDKSFKLAKLLNDTEVFNRDKSGYNINIVVLKIILRLTSSDGRGRIIDEREAVRLYAQRYLTDRPRVFFQMLHQIPGGGFNPETITERLSKYVEPLPSQSGHNPVIEIIPFEKLWDLILEVLHQKTSC